jgi:hypothetical protein
MFFFEVTKERDNRLDWNEILDNIGSGWDTGGKS